MLQDYERMLSLLKTAPTLSQVLKEGFCFVSLHLLRMFISLCSWTGFLSLFRLWGISSPHSCLYRLHCWVLKAKTKETLLSYLIGSQVSSPITDKQAPSTEIQNKQNTFHYLKICECNNVMSTHSPSFSRQLSSHAYDMHLLSWTAS